MGFTGFWKYRYYEFNCSKAYEECMKMCCLFNTSILLAHQRYIENINWKSVAAEAQKFWGGQGQKNWGWGGYPLKTHQYWPICLLPMDNFAIFFSFLLFFSLFEIWASATSAKNPGHPNCTCRPMHQIQTSFAFWPYLLLVLYQNAWNLIIIYN